jgi:hypothetical protein
MFRLFKLLGIMVAFVSMVDRASALSFEAVAATEDYTVTNMSAFDLTLHDFSLVLVTTPPTFINLITSPSPVTLSNGNSYTLELNNLSVGVTYNVSFTPFSTSTPTKFSEVVSTVPLPAGFPLFAMALLALGSLGYFGARRNKARTASELFAA